MKEKYDANDALPAEIIDIFQELVRQKDETLRSFLDAGADHILRDIDEREKYRRALEATKLKEEEKEPTRKQEPTGQESAFDRARRIPHVLQGAHILWVDDHPENNSTEHKILDSFWNFR